MERGPILFTWHSARRQHALALALALGAGGPLALATLLCLRDLVAVLVSPKAGIVPFLRVVVAWPGRAEPTVLLPGWPLPVVELTLAALVGLALAATLAAALGWAVGRLCFRAQTRALQRLNGRVTDAILRAPAAARDEVRGLTQLVGQLLARMDMLLGLGILAPALAMGSVLLTLILAYLAAPRLVPAVTLGLLAAGLARALILRRSEARSALRRRESAAAERALADLVRRMPAVRAHGAAAFERARIGAKGRVAREALTASESALAYARAPSVALGILLPAIALAASLWRGPAAEGESVDVGALAATGGAFVLAVVAISVVLRLWLVHVAAAPVFLEIALSLRGLQARLAPGAAGAAFPEAGPLAVAGAGAYDPVTGERLTGVTVTVPMPGHVAILGGAGSGSRVLAALLAGQLEPTAGAVLYAGTDLRALDPAERARRIALAGAEAILIEGTLRQNLLYGAAPEAVPSETELVAILHQTGLDAFVYARGLEGTVDPVADPLLSLAVVAARQAVRDALAADGAAHFVEPFDPARYGHQATVGENILFGEPVDPAFIGGALCRHPYLRAVLEAEDLTRPLVEVGLQVARSTVEIFADLPDDHPLFDAFSLFPAAERGFFEDLVARQPEARGWRRGPAGQRDRERLIGLALLYSETRHRFGLVDAAFEDRIVAARHSFRAMMPAHLRPGIAFYDPALLNPAASFEENILFGRINGEEAGAEVRVRALVRRVLSEQGLEPGVYRLGLSSRVEPGLGGGGASLGENAIDARTRIAIDLARCLVRRPDIVVVAIAFEDRKPDSVRAKLTALRTARAGTGLVVCLPDAGFLDADTPFDRVLGVERGVVSVVG
ncbi:multidrug ABC transporter ATP-binding protein [Methylobacterium sp. Leaf399]|uniref:ATP-binding cassette domain-containing protein n=1 Tax=Methylobacterium sp. Leaf399 TaxID=1736364 RepID=UPI0006FF509E|nr:ATP-binding cassette domain-containing protein [Methylobacterium sp. Leaf399]KQT19566.1 multidrug ABC transporter ATP-binding protein [Methylobacterium sp. Leaf399]